MPNQQSITIMHNHYFGTQTDWGTIVKKQIVHIFFKDGIQTIADLSKKTHASVPTVTKLILELINEGFVMELGKAHTTGGRKPLLYDINPKAGYFVGADLRPTYANLAIVDFAGNQVRFVRHIPFQLRASTKSGKELTDIIKNEVSEAGIDWEEILHVGISVAGPTDTRIGRNMYYYVSNEEPFSEYMSLILGVPTVLENVSRSKIAAEVRYGKHSSRDMVYLNLDEEFGMSYLVGGNLVYGHNGFAGNAGHATIPGNPLLCRCGKKGCLTTVSSGEAVHRMYLERLANGEVGELSEKYKNGEEITYNDVWEALKHGDQLAIDCSAAMSKNLVKILGITINMSNPNVIIIGGQMSESGEKMLETMREELKKTLDQIMYEDVELHLTSVGEPGAALGACIMAQRHYLDLQ